MFKNVRPFVYFNVKNKNYSTASGIDYLNEENGFVVLTYTQYNKF